MSLKGYGDKQPTNDVASDDEAASALAQGHPKSKVPPVGFGMKNRTNDDDGDDDDARKGSFGKD